MPSRQCNKITRARRAAFQAHTVVYYMYCRTFSGLGNLELKMVAMSHEMSLCFGIRAKCLMR